jgi:hypothetical protein
MPLRNVEVPPGGQAPPDTSRNQQTRPRSPSAPMPRTAKSRHRIAQLCGGVLRFYVKHRESRPQHEATPPPVHCVDPTNNASPEKGFAPPPGRNPDNIASPPHQNLLPANNLPPPTEAKSTEFRLTKKKKKIHRGEIPTAACGPKQFKQLRQISRVGHVHHKAQTAPRK